MVGSFTSLANTLLAERMVAATTGLTLRTFQNSFVMFLPFLTPKENQEDLNPYHQTP